MAYVLVWMMPCADDDDDEVGDMDERIKELKRTAMISIIFN